jgi:superfamily II RNA helicase
MTGDPNAPDESTPLTEFKGLRLLDFQIRAIQALRHGGNVLVSAPTGAGKTLVAEYAIHDAVRRGKRCIYTAPIKALSNQKFRDFRDDPEIDVGLMTGDVTLHPRAQVLIMTTEILRNSILEDPRSLDAVECVILDEVHFMDDPERGAIWEECLIFAPEAVRFLALSATIDNLEQVGAWMDEVRPHELEVVRSTRRPVPLKDRLWTAPAGIFTLERRAGVLRDARRRSGGRGRPRRGRRGPGGRPPRDENPVTELFDELERERLLPALVFSFSRRDCERLANRNRRRELLTPEEAARMERLLHDLIELFELDEGELQGEVFRLAAHGVGYHHAGMLPVHKEVVERLFASGLLKMLFTTETFALGINMPARTVVFAALRKFDGVDFDYLRRRDYLQMAGRAGRQGIDTEGLVISVLDERALEEAPLDRILAGSPEAVLSRFRPSYSTLLHLVEAVGRDQLHETYERSFHHFQHRGRSKKARERAARKQRALVDAHLAFLERRGFVEEDDKLTPKGRLARKLAGFEVQLAELLMRGAFENLPPAALAVITVGLVHEERRRRGAPPRRVPDRLFGGVRRHVDTILRSLAADEAECGVLPPLKLADWGLTSACMVWTSGGTFEDLEREAESTAGDVVRTFRMGIMLLKQIRRAIDPSWDLHDRLGDALDAVDRDVVDARRQLELG